MDNTIKEVYIITYDCLDSDMPSRILAVCDEDNLEESLNKAKELYLDIKGTPYGVMDGFGWEVDGKRRAYAVVAEKYILNDQAIS